MNLKRILYLMVIVIAFVIGGEVNINFESSPLISSGKIAIVNNDQKVEYQDSTLAFGDELVKQINNTDTNFKYETVSGETAEKGMSSGKYDGVITIPSPLSTSITSVDSEKPISTHIDYEISSQINTRRANEAENEIENILFNFQYKISYMYIYAIFDSIHTAQEGTGTIEQNQLPIYEFLDEIGAINILDNHTYELEEINTDSIEQIDLSDEYDSLSGLVSQYAAKLGDNVSIFQTANDEASQVINNQIEVFEESSKELEKQLSNMDNALANIVSNNEQYTSEDYSITNSKEQIQGAIDLYLSQLIDLNKINSDNQKLVDDVKELEPAISSLSKNVTYKFLQAMIVSRYNYYNAMGSVDSCLNSGATSDCLDENMGSLESKYTDYQNYIKEFKNESDYYTSIAYYLNQSMTDEKTKEAKVSDKPLTFTSNIKNNKNNTSENISPVSEEKEQNDEDILVSTKTYDSGLNDQFQIALTVDNTKANLEEITIGYTMNNLSSVSVIDNPDVIVNDNQIVIENAKPITYNVILEAKVSDDTGEASIMFDDNQSTTATIGARELNLNVEANIEDSEINLNFDYVNVDSEDITIDCPQLESIVSNINVDSDKVTLNENGFTIVSSELDEGEELQFTISAELVETTPNEIEYTINGSSYEYLVSAAEPISSDVSLEVDSESIEPNEQTRLEIELNDLVLNDENLEDIQFELSSKPVFFSDLNIESLKVNGDTIEGSGLQGDGEQYIIPNINYVSTNQVDSGYQFDIQLVLNATASSEFTNEMFAYQSSDIDYNLSLSNVYANETNVNMIENSEYVSEVNSPISIAIGNVSMDEVEYEVDGNVCDSDTSNLSECNFEGGESITRSVTITNTGDSAASAVNLVESFDSTSFEYGAETKYQLKPIDDAEIAGSVDEYYEMYSSGEAETSNGKSFDLTIPANSSLTITDELEISESITSESNVTVNQNLYQFKEDEAAPLFSSEQSLRIKPLNLEVTNITGEQVSPDGVITSGESVKVDFSIENMSSRVVSKKQNVVIDNSYGGIVDNIDVISIEDSSWNDITDYSVGTNLDAYAIQTNYDLSPGDSINYSLKYTFGDVPEASGAQNLVVSTYLLESDSSTPATPNNSYEYYLSTASYLELAKSQLANDDVVTGQTYSQAKAETSEVKESQATIKQKLSKIQKYIGNFTDHIKTINEMTTESNKKLKSMKIKLNKFGLGKETSDDDDPLAVYDYCQGNNELSCQIFDIYNNIYNSESEAKTYLENLLNSIDPNSEQVTGNVANDGENADLPANVGPYLNGYNCDDSETCEQPGIWQLLDNQEQNVQSLADGISDIFDTDLDSVSSDEYGGQLQSTTQDINEEMKETEVKNNQIFDEKIEVYSNNASAVMDYLDEVKEDDSYERAIKAYKNDEDARQQITFEILNNISGLMPNTYLDGMPNKNIYSFIAHPLSIKQLRGANNGETESDNSETNSSVISEVSGNHSYTLLFVLFLIVIGVLIVIYKFIMREE